MSRFRVQGGGIEGFGAGEVRIEDFKDWSFRVLSCIVSGFWREMLVLLCHAVCFFTISDLLGNGYPTVAEGRVEEAIQDYHEA